MRDRRNIDWVLLDRFVIGNCSAREAATIQTRIEADPELGRIVDAMRTIGDATGRNPTDWDERAAWTTMQQRLRDADVRSLHVLRRSGESAQRAAPPGRWTPRFPAGLAAAAVTLVVAAASALVLLPGRRSQAPVVAEVVRPREVVTKRGERATLDLADGSHVVLAPESRLLIPARFNEPGATSSRDLALTGEAHFTVTHDSTRPFRVTTATAIAEDIGTKFVVTAYPDRPGTRVVVEEGSVALRLPAPATAAGTAPVAEPLLVVEAGNMARVDESGHATLTRGVRVASYVAFAHGVIQFDGARLSDAIPRLERWYDLDISVTDSALRARSFTGSFTNVPAERMLAELSVALDADVARQGRSVRLMPTDGNPKPRK